MQKSPNPAQLLTAQKKNCPVSGRVCPVSGMEFRKIKPSDEPLLNSSIAEVKHYISSQKSALAPSMEAMAGSAGRLVAILDAPAIDWAAAKAEMASFNSAYLEYKTDFSRLMETQAGMCAAEQLALFSIMHYLNNKVGAVTGAVSLLSFSSPARLMQPKEKISEMLLKTLSELQAKLDELDRIESIRLIPGMPFPTIDVQASAGQKA